MKLLKTTANLWLAIGLIVSFVRAAKKEVEVTDVKITEKIVGEEHVHSLILGGCKGPYSKTYEYTKSKLGYVEVFSIPKGCDWKGDFPIKDGSWELINGDWVYDKSKEDEEASYTLNVPNEMIGAVQVAYKKIKVTIRITVKLYKNGKFFKEKKWKKTLYYRKYYINGPYFEAADCPKPKPSLSPHFRGFI